MPFLSFRLLLAAALAPAGMLLHANAGSSATRTIPLTVLEGHYFIEAQVPGEMRTVGDALASLHIPYTSAFVSPAPSTPLTPGMALTLLFPTNAFIEDAGGPPQPVTTFAPDVQSLLLDAHIALNPQDRVSPPLSATIREQMTIRITRVTDEERTETVAIPFPVITHDDPQLSWNKDRVVVKGADGSAKERVRIRTENGRMVKRLLLERTVLNPPVAEQRSRGTKIVIGRITEGGASWYRFQGGMFAASTMFPKGTFLRVTNLETEKQVIVQVNDFGPTAPGRVIDLDAVAFRKLKPLWQGVFPARVEEILSD